VTEEASAPAARITPDQAAEAIREVIRDRRGLDVAVTPATELDSLGLESQEIIDLFVLLEERTGCVVATDALEDIRVVADIARLRCA
jgi:acyl carrier protein